MSDGLNPTKIEHGGRQHTVWTGWDEGKTYKIGDQVNWWPLSNRPGVGIDGVYVAMDDATGGVAVVISGGVVAEVGFYPPEEFEAAHQALEAKWPRDVPARELWSEEIWAERERRANQMKKGFRRINQTISQPIV